MAHKCLIDGTAYEMKGGRCLVDGTAYAIQKGRTLVDGTGYDVPFTGGAIAVEITGSSTSTAKHYAEINGTKHTAATSGIEVFAGDTITFSCWGYAESTVIGRLYAVVSIDGNAVAQATGTLSKTYTWTVPDGIALIKISLIKLLNQNFNGVTSGGSVYVTTS